MWKRRNCIKKFKFNLEGLLRLRRIQEEKALGDMARVLVRVNEQEQMRNLAEKLVADEMNTFEKKYSDEFSIELFQMYDRYLERLESEAGEAAERLEQIRPELEKEKEKVLAARRNRRVVELLKEKSRAEYDREMRKWERRELLEINRLQRSKTSPLGALHEQQSTKKRTAESEQPDFEDMDLREPEQPPPEVDHIAEYFERMGLGKPPGRKR